MATHIFFDRNTDEEKHLKLSNHLNQFYGIIAILKGLQSWAFIYFNP